MSRQLEFNPSGLSNSQLERLVLCSETAEQISLEKLRQNVAQHIELARAMHAKNRIVNLRLALAIAKTIESTLEQWSNLAQQYQWWLAGAIYYFSACDDDEPDFLSPLGFEDDAEILNACLVFSGLPHLCLVVEDFDHA